MPTHHGFPKINFYDVILGWHHSKVKMAQNRILILTCILQWYNCILVIWSIEPYCIIKVNNVFCIFKNQFITIGLWGTKNLTLEHYHGTSNFNCTCHTISVWQLYANHQNVTCVKPLQYGADNWTWWWLSDFWVPPHFGILYIQIYILQI